MNSKTFFALLEDAVVSSDKDAYVEEWAISNVFEPGKNAPIAIYDEIVHDLDNIWDIAHITFKELLSRAEITMTECSTRFCIPFRTIQDWCAGRRTPPRYIILTIAEIVGVLNIEIE